ncbi:MAG: hypothetical protein H0U44_04070 [Flavisolibacter sp.]|jgi:hypothetical protein|nr:hypothetical protein [Flavisolibacter sp.]
MKLNSTIFRCIIKRKIATVICVSLSFAAFATLGDGSYNKTTTPTPSKTSALSSKTFSLRTGYNYRSNHILNIAPEKKFIMINAVTTFQKGNATYVLPLKKRVLLDKIKFNPSR